MHKDTGKIQQIHLRSDGSLDLAHYEDRARDLRSAALSQWFHDLFRREDRSCELRGNCLAGTG